MFLKEINTFIKRKCIELIKSDSKDSKEKKLQTIEINKIEINSYINLTI